MLLNCNDPILVEQILYLEGEQNYTWIHLTTGQKILSALTLKVFETRLAGQQFVRVHRAFLVNARHVVGCGMLVRLSDGTAITPSRRKRNQAKQLLTAHRSVMHTSSVSAAWAWLLLCLTMLTVNGVSAQVIRYVSPTAAGTGTGTSWADASGDLQLMINNSLAGDQVWVKNGTYYPTRDASGSLLPADSRSRSFVIKSGVKVYGGFGGTETTLADRFSASSSTCLLSGDIGVLGNASDNAHHVVTFVGAISGTELNGFTIQDGNASTSVFGIDKYGGGILCRANGAVTSAPTIMQCLIRNNNADLFGGGLLIEDGNGADVISCQFTSNTANTGGGATNSSGSSVRYTDCLFASNWAGYSGGAVSNPGSSPFFTNCTFVKNYANGYSGAVHNGSNASPSFVNCVFTENQTAGNGGAIGTYTTNNSTRMSLTNCTLAFNSAGAGGGSIAILTEPTATGTAQLTIVSTIIWSNSATTGSGGILNQTSVTPLIQYSDLQDCATTPGCATGTGNLSTDPLFAPGGPNVTLQPLSPLINKGDPTAGSPFLHPIDPSGLLRKVGNRVDIGAYENQMTTAIYSLWGNYWDDAYTWSCYCVPTTSDDVVLMHSVEVGYPAQARSLRFTAGGQLRYTASGLRLGTRVRYVKPTATGTGDGTSWANASGNLPATLAASQSGDEIWVQQGLYKPTLSTDRTASFSITSGVKVYGGFMGTETSLDQRRSNLTFPLTTTLSGAIGTTATNDNSYHVVWVQNAAAGTLLDGFVIAHGGTDTNTEIPVPPGNYTGGGIYNASSSGQSFSLVIQNCHVTRNRGAFFGGGLFNTGAGNVTLRNCLFDGNYGEYGGAIASPSATSGPSSYSSSVGVNIVNCNLVDNACMQDGMATYGGYLTISNSIIWANYGSIGSRPVFGTSYATGSTIRYSTVQNGSGSGMYVGSTVSNADPRFVSNFNPTNYQLRRDSPCINTGDPTSAYWQTGFLDLEGNYRIFLGQVDKGCFEFFSIPYQYP